MKVQIGVDIGSYVFTPGVSGVGTITFSGIPGLTNINQILMITNCNSGLIIYLPQQISTTGTFTGSTLTLNANTSAMSSSDPLTIFADIALDNTSLYSGTVSATGPGATISTTGFSKISFQFSGAVVGEVVIEGSNDNVTWFRLLYQNATDGSSLDVIYSTGIYTVQSNTYYIRYNALQVIDSFTVTVIGKLNDQDITSLLAQSFDPTSGIQMNVNVEGIKTDSNDALVSSDCPNLFLLKAAASGYTPILDTIGYQCINITSYLAGTISCSTDQVTWTAAVGLTIASGAGIGTTLVSGANYEVPCYARYFKFLSSGSAGYVIVTLRNQPAAMQAGVNIAQWGGATPISTGVAGTVPVGGAVAQGSSVASLLPVTMGGADAGNLARRLLTDTTGRLVPALLDQANVSRTLGAIAPNATIQNIPILPTQEQAVFEGLSHIEILALILQELKIHSYYAYNLPGQLNSGQPSTISDEPSNLRNEPSVLN